MGGRSWAGRRLTAAPSVGQRRIKGLTVARPRSIVCQSCTAACSPPIHCQLTASEMRRRSCQRATFPHAATQPSRGRPAKCWAVTRAQCCRPAPLPNDPPSGAWGSPVAHRQPNSSDGTRSRNTLAAGNSARPAAPFIARVRASPGRPSALQTRGRAAASAHGARLPEGCGSCTAPKRRVIPA